MQPVATQSSRDKPISVSPCLEAMFLCSYVLMFLSYYLTKTIFLMYRLKRALYLNALQNEAPTGIIPDATL